MSIIKLKKIAIISFIIFFNISFGAENKAQKKTQTVQKTTTPKKINNKKIQKKVVTKTKNIQKTTVTTPKNDNQKNKNVVKKSNSTIQNTKKTPQKTKINNVKPQQQNKTSSTTKNKKPQQLMERKVKSQKNLNSNSVDDVEKAINKTKKLLENNLLNQNKKKNINILKNSQKMLDEKIDSDKKVDRIKIDKITKISSDKILSLTKNSEEVLGEGSLVATDNYKILFTGINVINYGGSSELTKVSKLDTSFVVGFQIKKPEIELESVKVYLVVSDINEKLLILSKAPENRTKIEKNKPFLENWITENGKNSKIKGFGNEKNLISWNGESNVVDTISLKNLLKDNKINLENTKISQLKDLFSSNNKKYRYLFKFVIKSKGKEEEVIYQPGVLNVKLTGGKILK